MAVDLVVVRHGRTAWNREVRFRGQVDLPLDEVGQAQACAAAQSIRARWPASTAVYASPLRRAAQTAAPIAEALGLTVQAHPGLLDINYGAWAGLTTAEAEARDPELYRLWRTAPQQALFPGGESLAQLQARQRGLLEDVAQRHEGETVVLVGHVVVNRVLLCTLLGLDLAAFWRIGQEPAAINWCRYQDGSGKVLVLNDTCHLAEIGMQGGGDV